MPLDDKLIVARDPSTNKVINVGDEPNEAVRVNLVAGSGDIGAVTIADGADVAEGSTTDSAVVSDTSGTVSGKLRGLVKWAFERMPASLGQKLMSLSFPVVIASDQSTIPISGTVTTGGLTDAQLRATPVPVSGTVAATQSGTWIVQPGNTANTTAWKVDGSAVTQPISGTVAVSGSVAVTNANLDVALSTRLSPADTLAGVTVLGSISNALPAGTNNIGDVDVATIVGTTTVGANQVSVTTISGTVVAARAGRRSLLIVNHGTTDVYLGAGTVTTSNGVLLTGTKGASISIPTSAAVNGIVSSGTQTVSFIEVY